MIYLLQIFLSLTTGALTVASQERTLCVQTFNVYGPAYARNVSGRLQATAKELEGSGCQIVQIQELWQERDFNLFAGLLQKADYSSFRADALRRDRAMIGLSSHFLGKSSDRRSELYRVNNEGGIIDWFRGIAGVQKGFSVETFESEEGNLRVVNTHTHPTETTIRLAQMVQLLKAIQGLSFDYPLVVTGDFNATPDSKEMRLLTALTGLRDSYADFHSGYRDECTYCSSNPLAWDSNDRVIDFVFVRSGQKFGLRTMGSAINLQGDTNAPLSDHYGVRSNFSWTGGTPLLPVEDARVQARKSEALLALASAREELLSKRGAGFREAAEQIGRWESELKRGWPSWADGLRF
jgi:hypothetical protein